MNAIIPIRDQAHAMVEEISPDLQSALPATISFERFRATFITAVAHNPDILTCDRQSVKTALMKSAIDNLMPDNREAAIVPFNTKVKDPATGRENWVKLAQYMPMVQGIRKRALELGGARIYAECVYENDHFENIAGDEPRIEHKPAPFGKPRGEIIGAYAIFKDEHGVILHREAMPKEDIEAARNVSRTKDGPGWSKFYGEFARKTVVRRGSKSIPNIPDKLRTIIERDDDYVDFEQAAEKPRTIEHNPLLDDRRQIESNTQQPIGPIGAVTSEVIEVSPGEQSGTAVSPTPTGRKATDTNTSAAPASDKPSSSKGAEARDGGGSGSARGIQTTNSDVAETPSDTPATGSQAGSVPGEQSTVAPSLSRDTFRKYVKTIARHTNEENVGKATKKFLADEKITGGSKTEGDLFRTIREQFVSGVLKGGVTTEQFVAETEKWIVADVADGPL